MINGLEGIPGSGKSYEATVFHVLHALKKGRKVITNLPLIVEVFAGFDPAYADLIERRMRPMPVLGTWDPDRVDEKGQGEAYKLFEEGEGTNAPKASPTIFAGVWDYYTAWKHPITGQGPLFVIDECHNALPKDSTSDQVVEWYKLHRHFNVDVLLMTQSFRDMDQSIARLVENLVTVRKASVLGKSDSYIRKVKAGYRGAVISTEVRKYQPELFRLYKSHTQGNSVAETTASDVSPFIVKFKRFRNVFLAVGVVFAVWAFWPKPAKPKPVKPVAEKVVAAPKAAASAAAPAASAPEPVSTVGDIDYTEPYEGKGLHMTGRMTMGAKTVYTFLVSQGGQPIGYVLDADLRQVGYTFKALSDCTGVLVFSGRRRMVMCDSPTVAGGALPLGKVQAPPKPG